MQSPESSLEGLANRVERLESQYHWLKSEVVTEKLVLVDADGKTRATLRMSEGVPGLIVYDTNGNVCAILRVSADISFAALLASFLDVVMIVPFSCSLACPECPVPCMFPIASSFRQGLRPIPTSRCHHETQLECYPQWAGGNSCGYPLRQQSAPRI
jgi:hypothetical protein